MANTRAHVIVIANQKGGCGKTTTAVNLAGGFARLGHATCLVDLDSQCNATTTFGIRPEQLAKDGLKTIADAFIASRPGTQIVLPLEDRFDGKLSLLPGHRSLDIAKTKLESEIRTSAIEDDLSPYDEEDIRREHRFRLRKSLKPLVQSNDFIVIDTPPRLGFELTAALVAADWYIIPLTASLYDVDGLSRLLDNVKKVQTRENRNIRLLGVLISEFKPNTNLHADVRAKLKQKFGDKLFDTVIHDSVRFPETPYASKTIFEHAPGQQSSEQFAEFTSEVLKRLEGTERVEVAAEASVETVAPAPAASLATPSDSTELAGVANE